MSLSIFDAARRRPDAPFVISEDRVVSFSAMAARVNGAMAWLLENGAVRGQPFPLVARRDLPSLALLLGLFELGAPALLLHPRWTRAECEGALQSVGLELRVPDADWPAMDDVELHSTAVVHPPTAPLVIVFTTGTTGAPRGIVLSRGAFEASARASACVAPLGSDERWLLGLPLAHVGGLSIVTRCLTAEAAIVLLPEDRTFDPAKVLSILSSLQVTRLSLVPIQLQRILDTSDAATGPAGSSEQAFASADASPHPHLTRRASGGRCPAAIRSVLLGGAASPRALVQRAQRGGWPVLPTYGMTETCSQVTLTRPGDPLKAGSSGRPLPGTEVRIRDGLIEVRSPSLFSGYYPSGEAPLSPDGYFRTSDCGEMRSGELFVLGRRDDVIVTGGENVHPLEVEMVLMDHPAVAACCVCGITDERWGAIVAAAIVACGDLQGLSGWLSDRLARFKLPRRISLLSELPTNTTGKVDRRAVTRQLLQLSQPLEIFESSSPADP